MCMRFNSKTVRGSSLKRSTASTVGTATSQRQNGKVSFISKGFPLSDEYEAARVYTQASKEVRRRGGTVCESREVEFTDDIIHEFETRCGSYRLTFYLPSRTTADEPVSAGISITLGGRR